MSRTTAEFGIIMQCGRFGYVAIICIRHSTAAHWLTQNHAIPLFAFRQLGAGWQCQYPNICPNFVPCQNMSSKCPPYVLKMSMPSICPEYDLRTQLSSWTCPIFILGVNFCPVFVPRNKQISLRKLEDKIWTKIDIDERCMKDLVTLSPDVSWTFHGQTEIQILSN